MERDLIARRRSTSYYAPGCMMSPSCFPIPEEMDYSRISHYSRPVDRKRLMSRRWRNFLRRLVSDGKSFYGSKSLSFHYDAVSYSQNFDDGFHKMDESHRYCPRVLRDVRWELHEYR